MFKTISDIYDIFDNTNIAIILIYNIFPVMTSFEQH